MTDNDTDYTGKVGPLHSNDDCEWPMYSFDRVSAHFWNGFANALRDRGLSDEQIKDELQSKGPRWLLDQYDADVESLGRTMGQGYVLCVTPEPPATNLKRG